MSTPDEGLDDSTLRALLDALAVSGAEGCAPAELRARVLARVARSVRRPDKPPVAVVRAHEGTWLECIPGVRVKILHDDGITQTLLARLDKGVRVPAHAHEMDEECLVIEGTLVLDGVALHAGDYQVARAGTRHESAVSPTGCLALLRSASPRRSAPA